MDDECHVYLSSIYSVFIDQQYPLQAGKFGKLNKWIDFPEVLDMAPYMSQASDDKAPVYKLYGVIVHLDTMNATFSGHYVCYVKNIQNKWFLIDDSMVSFYLSSSKRFLSFLLVSKKHNEYI